MAPEVITRAEAKAQGLTRYFTGKPCKHGHIAERHVANGVCAECFQLIEKKYRQSHPEKIREKNRQFWKKNPEKRRAKYRAYYARRPHVSAERGNRWRKNRPDLVSARDKRYRERNREKHLAKIKRYHGAHRHTKEYKDQNLARVKQWALENPEQARAHGRKSAQARRARLLKVPGSYTLQQISDLLVRQNFKCVYCPTLLHKRRELDHIIPLTKPGTSNDISNLQWLCQRCNRMKRDKDPDVFALEIAAFLAAETGDDAP